MSIIDNRQTGPSVYNYAGNNNTQSYVAPGQYDHTTIGNIQRTSNVEVNGGKSAYVHQTTTEQPITHPQKSSQFKGSRAD